MMVNAHLEKLSSALWQLQQSSAFCDTVLVVSGNVKMKAHAAVLVAASSQLCSLLQPNRVKNIDSHGTCYYLDIPDYDVSTVAVVLRYIYTGEMTALTSLNSSSRNDFITLCSLLGITVDDNSFDMELRRQVIRYLLVIIVFTVFTVLLCDEMHASYCMKNHFTDNSCHQ